jgi:hypothetical protein
MNGIIPRHTSKSKKDLILFMACFVKNACGGYREFNIYWVSEKECRGNKSEMGRVAPAFPGRHGPAPMKKQDIIYLRLNKH